ncbi:MAG: hypothetical protein WCI63_04460 [bacterium]
MGIFDFLKKSGAVQAGGTSYTVEGGAQGPEYKDKEGNDVTGQVMEQDLRNNDAQTTESPSETEVGSDLDNGESEEN